MNFEALQKNLIDFIKESQIKLGYDGQPIGLYYPLESLNALLGADLDAAGMQRALEGFGAFTRDTLGAVAVSRDGDRFCLRIPAEGVAYVHDNVPDAGFLPAFLAVIGRHGIGIIDILEVFHKYSDRVKCARMNNDEFDYLIYFEDGVPDDYRYCIKLHGDHASYHRFTPHDYESFGF